LADHVLKAGEPQLAHNLSNLFCEHEKIIYDAFWFARELRTELWVLRCNPDGAGIEVALSHHNAPKGDQRRGRKSKFLGAEQGCNHDISTGFDLAIGL
jgi:hypothetical protein